MEPIPGSASVTKAGELAGIEALNTTYPTGSGWGTARRWDQYGGEQPPMTAPRVRAISDKRACVVLIRRDDGAIESIGGGVDGDASKTHAKPKNWLAEFVFAAELLAGYASGALFAFPIENRRGKEYVPTAAKWKLRTPHLRVLAVIAGAMIGLKKRGVVIAHRELAKLKTSSGRSVIGLQERQLGTVVRELCAWGLVRRTPVAVARGKATSFRANAYQLTTLAAGVYRLTLPSACGALPEPMLRDLPVAKIASTGSASIRQELPGNPETPLRGISPEEHAAFPPEIVGEPTGAHTVTRANSVRCTQCTAATCERCRSTPADVYESLNRSQPAALPETRSPVGRRVAPRCVPAPEAEAPEHTFEPQHLPSSDENAIELELAQRRAGEAARAALRDQARSDLEERYVEGDRRETERRLRRARAVSIVEEKALLERRQAAQLELVRRREDEGSRDRRGSRGAVLEQDAPMNNRIDTELADLLRRERESLRDEQETARRYNLQGPTKKDPDADFVDVIENAWRTKFGGVPVVVEVALDKIRGGKS